MSRAATLEEATRVLDHIFPPVLRDLVLGKIGPTWMGRLQKTVLNAELLTAEACFPSAPLIVDAYVVQTFLIPHNIVPPFQCYSGDLLVCRVGSSLVCWNVTLNARLWSAPDADLQDCHENKLLVTFEHEASQMLQVWDLSTGQVLATRSFEGSLRYTQLLDGGRALIDPSDCQTLLLWNFIEDTTIETPDVLRVIFGSNHGSRSFAVGESGLDGRLAIVDGRTAQSSVFGEPSTSLVICGVSPSGLWVAIDETDQVSIRSLKGIERCKVEMLGHFEGFLTDDIVVGWGPWGDRYWPLKVVSLVTGEEVVGVETDGALFVHVDALTETLTIQFPGVEVLVYE